MSAKPKALTKSYLKELDAAESHLKASLAEVRRLRNRGHGQKAPAMTAAVLAGGPTLNAASAKQVAVYNQLIGLFGADGKPVALIEPQTVLGAFPLGYTNATLANFYANKVDPWFGCTVTIADVGIAGTVWQLVLAIIAAGGEPR
jgi:hypothetical protein